MVGFEEYIKHVKGALLDVGMLRGLVLRKVLIVGVVRSLLSRSSLSVHVSYNSERQNFFHCMKQTFTADAFETFSTAAFQQSCV